MAGTHEFTPGDRVIGNDRRLFFRGRTGTILEHGPGKSEYWVAFDDGQRDCVESSWIELLEAVAAAAGSVRTTI